MTPKTIAVHGATGSQGAPVAAALTAAGHDVRPATRASGADLEDPAALTAAYEGVDAVVLHLPLVYDERVFALAANAVQALELAGVEHLVLNTGAPIPPEPVGVPYLDARHRVAAARVPKVTVLQPTAYMENLSAPWSGARVVSEGVLAYPLPPEVPMTWMATDDLAAAVVTAIDGGVTGNYVLPGAPVTGHEVVAALGAVLDRPVRWETITPDAFADALRPHVGDHAAEGTAGFYRMAASAPPPPAPDPAPAREALGWAPRDIAAWARTVAWPVAQAA